MKTLKIPVTDYAGVLALAAGFVAFATLALWWTGSHDTPSLPGLGMGIAAVAFLPVLRCLWIYRPHTTRIDEDLVVDGPCSSGTYFGRRFYRIDVKTVFGRKRIRYSRLFPDGSAPPPHADLVIDLDRHRCGRTPLGAPLSKEDFFSKPLSHDVPAEAANGLRIDTVGGMLACVFVTVNRFAGRFRHRDGEVRLNPTTTVEEVLARFGEPYWRNEDEDEVILFYEDDPVETQFEFPDKKHLGFMTILTPPLLADSVQHKAYGVTKPWPPGRPG